MNDVPNINRVEDDKIPKHNNNVPSLSKHRN